MVSIDVESSIGTKPKSLHPHGFLKTLQAETQEMKHKIKKSLMYLFFTLLSKVFSLPIITIILITDNAKGRKTAFIIS